MTSDSVRRSHVNAAILSIAAGVVHLAASGSHRDVGVIGALLATAGMAQLALGLLILLAPQPSVLLATAIVNGIAVLAWAASRTVGLPLPGAAGEVQSVGVQDLAAALLGIGALAASVRAFLHPSAATSAGVKVIGAVAIALALAGIVAPHDHGSLDQSVPILEAGRLSERLPPQEAIALLGLAARGPLSGSTGHSHSSTGGHGMGFVEPPPPEKLSEAQLAAFEQQWAQAVDAAESLATLDAAVALGYAQASTEALGVGAHWVKWSLVEKPFDPARPSMLLYMNMRFGQPPELVGFSYWVASAEEPEGFAGPNDKWHTHHGMCFIDGWLRYESVELREDCTDTWIDGSDLWMLHAWPASRWPNSWGPFADINKSLCGRKPHTPDILTCEPTGL